MSRAYARLAAAASPRVIGCTKLLYQYGRFIVIGGLATATHIGIFALLMERDQISGLSANALAFLVALSVSFFGHFFWTYRENTQHIRFSEAQPEIARFVVTAVIGLLLNSVVVWIVTEAMRASYLYALVPMATVVPALVFVMQRFWVFPASKVRNVRCD